MRNIFFDLDGTLIDSRPRLYSLFQDLVKESALSFDEYWGYKRNKVSHKQILSEVFDYSIERIHEFELMWMSLIENHELLAMDKPFHGVYDFLLKLKKENKLFLVTARQSEERAIEQIEQLGWIGVFERIFVTGQKFEKYEMIVNVMELSALDWFVGDTGKDIQTGKMLGIRTAAVLSGFLSNESLLAYKPDLIGENVMGLDFK